jgi:hypothetical protein
MAAAPPASGQNGGALYSRPGIIPPEESVWKRYSPHHELPVSVTTSAAIHAVFFALLIFGLLGVLFLRETRRDSQLVGVMSVTDDKRPGQGSGDNRSGDGNSLDRDGRQEAGNPPPPAKVDERPRIKAPELRKPQVVHDIDFLIKDPKYADDPTEAMETLRNIDKATRELLIKGITDQKTTRGPGPRNGPRTATLDVHLLRALRWTMVFNRQDGQDYRRQIAGLTAQMKEKTIVAIKEPDGRYRVFRDLESDRPVSAIEDLSTIQLIFWVDNKPDSVRALSQALGLAQPPPSIAILFPEELENKLLRIELAHASLRDDQEEEIKETRFGIVHKGSTYEPVVTGQRLKGRP